VPDCEPDDRTPLRPLVFCSLLWFFPLYCSQTAGSKSCAAQGSYKLEEDIRLMGEGIKTLYKEIWMSQGPAVAPAEFLTLAIHFKISSFGSFSIPFKCASKKSRIKTVLKDLVVM